MRFVPFFLSLLLFFPYFTEPAVTFDLSTYAATPRF